MEVLRHTFLHCFMLHKFCTDESVRKHGLGMLADRETWVRLFVECSFTERKVLIGRSQQLYEELRKENPPETPFTPYQITARGAQAVSYTHLTLPTKRIV